MVDCGEGAQLQMRRSGLSFGKLGHIFISHIHGDHCFGLIGMISTFGLLGRTAKLHVYAPAALESILQEQMNTFCTDLGYEVVFHAVNTSTQEIVYEDRSLCVETIPLNHRLPCCGYLFREKPGLPHIRRDMLECFEIPVSQINNIKAGQDYVMPDGTVIANERLVTPAEEPRRYAYCSDTCFIASLGSQLRGVNTIYHESTYAEDNMAMARKYYHSTAREAAQVALEAGASKLILGHYSSRYTDENVLLNEAKKVFPHAVLSDEMKVFDV
jgi:ribonuclease Z